MRILHVTPYYEQAWAYGGIPRVVGALARGLDRRGHRVTVCATDACGESTRLAPGARGSGGVELKIFPNLSNRLAYHLQFFVPLGLDAWLARRAREFDVAHLHACHNWPAAIAARHLRRARVPYAVEPHGTAPRIERRRAAKWLFDQTLGRGVLDGAARVLALTPAEARSLAGLGVDGARVRVVPNPIELEDFAEPIARGRLGAGWPEKIVYLGKLTPRKRLDLLIDAFAQMARPRAELVIAGSDFDVRRALERRARRLGVGERVRFLGAVAGRARLEILADASVVAYAAEREAFGLVPLEALLCGAPVVVADDDGAAEVIARVGGGRVIAAGDVAALARALGEILDDPERWRRAAADARPRIAEAYDAARICAELETVYREMAA